MGRHGPTVYSEKKALLFNQPVGFYVGEQQLCEGLIACSAVVQLGAASSASSGRVDRDVLGQGPGSVPYRSWRWTKWHEATLFMQYKPCKRAVFSGCHCGLLPWWLIRRLELSDDVSLWAVLVMPSWDSGQKGKHGRLWNPDWWVGNAGVSVAVYGGGESEFDSRTDTCSSLMRFRHWFLVWCRKPFFLVCSLFLVWQDNHPVYCGKSNVFCEAWWCALVR